MEKDEYKCRNCGEIWGFCPEDYEDKKDWPTICPLCNMPFFQMIKDTFIAGGIRETSSVFLKRYFKKQ